MGWGKALQAKRAGSMGHITPDKDGSDMNDIAVRKHYICVPTPLQ
jgi:hypothetical protein